MRTATEFASGSSITAVAHFVPEEVRSNAELSALLGVTEEWIVERTGIHERRILKDGATSDLIVPAAQECLRRAGITAEEVDLILVATLTPDHLTPSTASIVGHRLGATRAWGFDLGAACSGFIYGLVVADSFIRSGQARRVLVCAGDRLSSVTNLRDRTTAVLFGDGAGAALVEASSEPDLGTQDFIMQSDGNGGRDVLIPAGGSRQPVTPELQEAGQHCLSMAGWTVAQAAIGGLSQICRDLMERNALTAQNLDWFVPHQANLRILEAIASKLDFPMDKVVTNVQRYGNTSAACIPIGLSEFFASGQLRKGDKVLMCSIGAGYTYGGLYLKWAI